MKKLENMSTRELVDALDAAHKRLTEVNREINKRDSTKRYNDSFAKYSRKRVALNQAYSGQWCEFNHNYIYVLGIPSLSCNPNNDDCDGGYRFNPRLGIHCIHIDCNGKLREYVEPVENMFILYLECVEAFKVVTKEEVAAFLQKKRLDAQTNLKMVEDSCDAYKRVCLKGGADGSDRTAV